MKRKVHFFISFIIISMCGSSQLVSAYVTKENCNELNCIGDFECYKGVCRSRDTGLDDKEGETTTLSVKADTSASSATAVPISGRSDQRKDVGLLETIGLFVGIPFGLILTIGMTLCCIFCKGCPLHSFLLPSKHKLQRPQGIIGYEKLGEGRHGNLVQYGASAPKPIPVEGQDFSVKNQPPPPPPLFGRPRFIYE